MSLRFSAQMRSFISRFRAAAGSGSSTFATSTIPRMKPHASSTAHHIHAHQPRIKLWPLRADFVPVYVSLGLIATSLSFGVFTAVHHRKWAPNVRVKKSLRETIPEVAAPERVVEESDHFITDSFFRKVAHVQDSDRQQVMPNPVSGDVYACKQHLRAATLEGVGVEPPNDSPPHRNDIQE